MAKYRVLLTDYAWEELEIEKQVLADNDVELIVATAKDEDSLVALAQENQVDAIMTNWAQVTEKVIAASPNVKIVARLGIGLDNIDMDYCTSHGILVTNTPDYCLTEVAEHTLALIFACSRKVAMYHHDTMSGKYDLTAGPIMRRMEGQTLGIVGLGNIGMLLAQKAKCLGLNVLATSRSGKTMEGVETVEMDRLLAESDYVSLLIPATPETRKSFGAKEFQQMKPTAYLINTARGAIVDHDALAAAIEAGELAGAALDVQDPEPCDLTIAPYNDPRVIVTPHAAFVSVESLENMRSRVSRQVVDCLQGKTPENVRNGLTAG
ncbi:C-terminal binding protein [Bremerella sp. T1]|uniref:C-terminal binding protein n=1 Tax=Bremerella sp. TYQ1 TaxID=3119568 RepID=UPI001CCBE753|nr:C-terminal binding protein [Bremerella volcania]UBM34630.1 C-terminal binding protein [Bremerella volcania]